MSLRLVKIVRDGVGAPLGDSVVRYEPLRGTPEEIREALRWKLVEEAIEYARSGDVEELADVYEAFCANLDGMRGKVEVMRIAAAKRRERGGFDGATGMWVETTAMSVDEGGHG